MSVKVKICGIRTLEAAKAAVDAGADFLGFNFVRSSKRFIRPLHAKKIIDIIRGKARIVGVFQDADLKEVNSIAKDLSLDFVQLHGGESEEYCMRAEAPVIKVFKLPADFSVQKALGTMTCYSIPLYMIDRERRGEGDLLDLDRSRELASKFPLFFSGGLTSENVSNIVQTVRPFAVDVAGGIETDGKENLQKIQEFVVNAKSPSPSSSPDEARGGMGEGETYL